MNKHKILYVHPSNELYGADRYLLRLVRALDKQMFAPVVVVANDIEYEGLLTDELDKSSVAWQEMRLGVLRRRYQNAGGMALFGYRTAVSALQIAAYCRRHQVSLLHSNSSAVFAGGLAARLARIPHIWHIHEIITQPQWLNKLIARNLDVLADQVVAVSTPVKDNLLLGYPQLDAKIRVIHNGIDHKKFSHVQPVAVQQLRQQWQATPNTVVIGMIGRISAWKGQPFFLQAAARMVNLQPNIRFVLVGGCVPGETWRLDALRQQVDELGLAPFVHIDDFRLDIPTVLAAFDIFALPSIRPDPFPTVVLEAMAAAKPVVATAHGGATEQLDPGQTGFLVSPTDPAEMASAFQVLVDDVEKRQAMGQNGRFRLLEHFTTQKHTQKIVALYNETIL